MTSPNAGNTGTGLSSETSTPHPKKDSACKESGCTRARLGPVANFPPYPETTPNVLSNMAQKEDGKREGCGEPGEGGRGGSNDKATDEVLSQSESGSGLQSSPTGVGENGEVPRRPHDATSNNIIVCAPTTPPHSPKIVETKLSDTKAGSKETVSTPKKKHAAGLERARGKKILAQNERSETSEGSEIKNKRAHTSYRKSSVRAEVTRRFFSCDWYADWLRKYSIGK